jgi:hypothetical protein
LEDIVEEEETYDWSKMQTLADKSPEEETKEKKKKKKKDEEPKEEVYAKDGPFADNMPLLMHRLLYQNNYEYVFFTSESGSKDIGVFLVLLEALFKDA